MRQHGKGLLREENMAFMNLHRCKIANFEDKINPHKHFCTGLGAFSAKSSESAELGFAIEDQ